MVPLADQRLPLSEPWRCALPPIASIMARRFPSRSLKYFRWHKPLEIRQGEALHDSEEIGPALLAQVAKKTGLQTADL